MTPEAAVVRALLRELDAVMAMGGVGKQRDHMLGCQHGLWLSYALRGEPCSARCEAAKRAIRAARQWLADPPQADDPEQMTMEAM